VAEILESEHATAVMTGVVMQLAYDPPIVLPLKGWVAVADGR